MNYFHINFIGKVCISNIVEHRNRKLWIVQVKMQKYKKNEQSRGISVKLIDLPLKYQSILQSKYSDIRQDYDRHNLRHKDLNSSPFWQLRHWLEEAIVGGDALSTAMSLATVDSSGQPTQRIVLLKDVSDDGISFFTNYNSSKGSHLANNSKVSANLFWPVLERQVRWEGRAVKLSAEASDNYFASRPRESRIGAWASPQSEKVKHDQVLIQRVEDFEKKFQGEDVPRPSHWGGYLIVPHKVEFWQGRPDRMHQRFVYSRRTDGSWEISQVAP